MRTQKDVLNLIVAGAAAKIASTAGVVATPGNLAAGEVVVTDVSGRIVSTAAVPNEIYIVQGQGPDKPLIKSALIRKSKVTRISSRAYTPAAEQLSYWGFNGTTGAIDATMNNNNYVVKVALHSDTQAFGDKLTYLIADYKSDSTATQAEVAAGLAKSFAKSRAKWATEACVKVERVSNGTATATTAAVTATFNSPIITTTQALVVGSFIRFGLDATSPVYMVAAAGAAANTFVLDAAYQDPSAVFALGTAQTITAATALIWGLKFTGLTRPFVAGYNEYYKNRFTISATNAGTTIAGTVRAANKGVGMPQEIAQLEWELMGNEGSINKVGMGVPAARTTAANQPHSIINIQFIEDNGDFTIQGKVAQFKEVMIAVERTGATTAGTGTLSPSGVIATATSVPAVLNAFITTPFNL
jgi:hypothetical protein